MQTSSNFVSVKGAAINYILSSFGFSLNSTFWIEIPFMLWEFWVVTSVTCLNQPVSLTPEAEVIAVGRTARRAARVWLLRVYCGRKGDGLITISQNAQALTTIFAGTLMMTRDFLRNLIPRQRISENQKFETMLWRLIQETCAMARRILCYIWITVTDILEERWV